MNDTGMSKHDQVLMGLVFSLQAAAMQHLGKIKNPLSDKVERNLEQARGTIDMLEMLKAKCRQDTPEELLRLLDSVVMDLQMNFLDESKRGDADEAADEAVADVPAEDPDEASDDAPVDD